MKVGPRKRSAKEIAVKKLKLSYESKAESFEKAAKPLIKWLATNVHPHHSAIVTSTDAELLESEMLYITHEFLKD